MTTLALFIYKLQEFLFVVRFSLNFFSLSLKSNLKVTILFYFEIKDQDSPTNMFLYFFSKETLLNVFFLLIFNANTNRLNLVP